MCVCVSDECMCIMYMCECVWGRSDECVCILYMCECVWGSSVPWHTHQKTASKSWFSLSTIWVPGIEPRYSGLLASLLSDLLSLLTAFQVPVWNQIFSALNFRLLSLHLCCGIYVSLTVLPTDVYLISHNTVPTSARVICCQQQQDASCLKGTGNYQN